MKKFLAVLCLALVMALSACGKEDTSNNMRRISLAYVSIGEDDISERCEGYIEIGPIADEIDFNFVIDAHNGFKINFKGHAYNPSKSAESKYDSTYYDVDVIEMYNELEPDEVFKDQEKFGRLVFYNDGVVAYGLTIDGELLFIGFTDDNIEK